MPQKAGSSQPGPEDKAAPRTYTRREFLKAAGGALAAAGLAACMPTSRPELSRRSTASTGEKAQLVYQDWRTEWFPEMAQTMLDQFHQTHPNIRVYYTPDPDNLESRMMLDMASGTAPDVLAGCCDFFPIWAQNGYLLDLRPYVQADLDRETIAEWDQAQYKALFTRDGLQFGLPKYLGSLALYYNKDLFDQYGVSYPDGSWTHDDYLTAMKKLTHDTDNDGLTDLWGSMLDISWERIQVHVNGWGGHFVDPQDATRAQMSAKEAMDAMEWIRARMWDDKVMATFLDVQNLETRQAFIQQKIAMVEDGSWALKDIFAQAPFRLGVAPFPRGPARKVTLASTDGFGIYAGTKHPEAAWELMKFLISKDYGRAMAKANFLQPARSSLFEDWAGYIKQDYPEKSANIDLSAFVAGQREGYSVTAEIFSNMTEARKLAMSAWEQIFTLGQAPTALMQQVATQIEAAQKKKN